ncbi:MAG TPA: 30S ribosomal protein S8 [Candidatus Magasanikbacteria bacterium]|nr:MAG: 30S ribosomal protein S8 [Candidatus Magasanikbacteria bacterium RIFCSPLOWO2_02_FULL_47_16]OGH79422.1 MAG: 30S ribosomal protein S8 [Candidatus Magasanikbacteria bacterium RIFCSPHIGHO2_02_FULL_48_18]OGH81901.1 MAG: 30S ribosomal protein S8 [Candidatus Magasanikbacteria bacterium RIFCSPLOWO2_12_FULL_47_9b]HAZ28429.1 30S ribosomal protein S8 [Candidatus Magasanikbacteria bacterium]
MMMTDPIADMLTRIRNAQMARKDRVEIPLSKTKEAIAHILLEEGYIEGVEKKEAKPAVLLLTLKYYGKRPAIQSIKRESAPGHRKYQKAKELPNVLNGYGIAIVSTSYGIMTNKMAREKGIGGELLCSVF